MACVRLYLDTEPGLDQAEPSDDDDSDDSNDDDDDDDDDDDSEIFSGSASNPFGSDKGQVSSTATCARARARDAI